MYHLVEVTKYSHSPNYYVVLASFKNAEEVLKAQAHKRKEKEIFKKNLHDTDYIVMSEVEVKTRREAA